MRILGAGILLWAAVGATGAIKAADRPVGEKTTTADAPVLLRAQDVILDGGKERSADDLALIHPWDNNQIRDTMQVKGTGTGIRPFVRDEEWDQLELASVARKAERGRATAPEAVQLLRNYPNPFNAETRIEFMLTQPGPVELAIYNLLGQTVRAVNLESLASGQHAWTWDGRVERGMPAPSGVYFYRVTSGGSSAISRMVLLK